MSLQCRYFVSYTGLKLPFKFVNEISDQDLGLRNTYFKAFFEDDVLLSFQKIVYGEVEYEHQYDYYNDGTIKQAKIAEFDSDDIRIIAYNDQGTPIS